MSSPEEAAVAMLTLRVEAPAGEWLSGKNETLFFDLWREAESATDGGSDLLLSMLNLAWYALINLSTLTGESEQTWLARIAADSGPDVGPVTNS